MRMKLVMSVKYNQIKKFSWILTPKRDLHWKKWLFPNKVNTRVLNTWYKTISSLQSSLKTYHILHGQNVVKVVESLVIIVLVLLISSEYILSVLSKLLKHAHSELLANNILEVARFADNLVMSLLHLDNELIEFNLDWKYSINKICLLNFNML